MENCWSDSSHNVVHCTQSIFKIVCKIVTIGFLRYKDRKAGEQVYDPNWLNCPVIYLYNISWRSVKVLWHCVVTSMQAVVVETPTHLAYSTFLKYLRVQCGQCVSSYLPGISESFCLTLNEKFLVCFVPKIYWIPDLAISNNNNMRAVGRGFWVSNTDDLKYLEYYITFS